MYVLIINYRLYTIRFYRDLTYLSSISILTKKQASAKELRAAIDVFLATNIFAVRFKKFIQGHNYPGGQIY